jgi:hydroxymethylglutaryl-CoA lyase
MGSSPLQLIEMAPRDGLQSLGQTIPLDVKVAFVDALSEIGVSEIEAGAFVSLQAIPAMADSLAVFQKISRKKGVLYSALVPNERGFDEALKARADKISVFTAASETFNQKNINATIAESLLRFKPVIQRAMIESLPIRAYVSTAFFCPYEGKIRPQAALKVSMELLALGVNELSIGDTIGRASPDDVRVLLDLILKSIPASKIVLHFHDTYSMAIANALTAFKEYGVSRFDASSGGLGGCPYAPGASGNVALEDLAFAFEASGAKTGIDLNKVKFALSIIQPHLALGLVKK